MSEENELKKALAEVAATAGSDTVTFKSAFAQTIVQAINPTRLSLDSVRAIGFPVVNLNPGDNLEMRVRKGRYPVRTFVPSTMHLTDQVYSQDKPIWSFERLVAGTSCSAWELQSGELGTVASFKKDLKNDIMDSIVARVFNLLTSVWNPTNTPSNYVDASSGGLTATILDTMIENIMERSPNVRAIVGQRRALLPLYNFAGYTRIGASPDISTLAITPQFEEFYSKNKVSEYKGIPIVELAQVFEGNLPDIVRKLIRTDVVMVIGEDPGKVALYGGFEYQDYTDPRTQPPNYVLHGWQAFSMMVDRPESVGIIKTNT